MSERSLEQIVYDAMGFKCDEKGTFGERGITSLDFIQGIVKLEDQLGLEFPDSMLVMDRESTVSEFIEAVERMVNEHGGK